MPITKINPYLEIGNIHNQALNWIAGQLGAPAVPETNKIVELVLAWYVTQVPEATPEQRAGFYALTASGMNYAQQYSVDELCQLAKLSEQATDFITKACALTGEFSWIISQLNELTTQALDADLSENDKPYTLLTLAIALKSAEYGLQQQELGSESPWSGYGNRAWPWSADAHGGLAGAIGGAIAGAIAGVAGGFAGIFVGFVGGGIIGGYSGAIGESVASYLE
ncbi:hypothetical protein GCM10027594_14950 [Hymenobacter agri]